MPVFSGTCTWNNAVQANLVTVDLPASGEYGRIVVAGPARTHFDASYRDPRVPPLGQKGADVFGVALLDPYTFQSAFVRCAASLYRDGDAVVIRVTPRGDAGIASRLPRVEARLYRIHAENSHYLVPAASPRRWSRPLLRKKRRSAASPAGAVVVVAALAAAAFVAALYFIVLV